MKINQMRVLIADGNNAVSNRLNSYLRDSGFSTKIVPNGYSMEKAILEWRPQFLFIDLMFPGYYAQKCLKFLNEQKLLGSEDGIHVIVMSNHTAEMNVMACLQAGAGDFLVKPLKMIEVLHRLSLLSQTKQFSFHNLVDKNDLQITNYFEMIELLTKASSQNKPLGSIRFDMIRMLSMALKAVRISLVLAHNEKSEVEVIASSDDESVTSISLDLEKYPELQYVLRTEKSLFIESIETDKTMAFVQNEVKTIQFSSMMVLPIKNNGKFLGCLSVRMSKEQSKLSLWDIKLAQIAAQLIAITWKFGKTSKAIKAA